MKKKQQKTFSIYKAAVNVPNKKWSSKCGYSIELSDEVIDQFKPFVQSDRDSLEACGALMAEIYSKSKRIEIVKISVPQVNDIRFRCSFISNSKYHNKIISEVFEQSNGHISYVGGWHSHPESIPKPSQLDLNEWKRTAAKEVYVSPLYLQIIVGIKEINLWIINK